MKKNLFMVAAVALMAMVSCNKIENNNGGEEVVVPTIPFEFTAYASEDAATSAETQQPAMAQKVDTKAALVTVEGKPKTHWEATDKIKVNGFEFEVDTESEYGAGARFVGKVGENFGTEYKAVYPSTAGTWDAVTVKSSQTAKADTFDPEALVAVAYSNTDNVLAFKHVTSLLKFQVPAACQTVTISSDNALAGTIKITNVVNDDPSTQPKNESDVKFEVTTSQNTLTVTCEGGFKTGTDYYVAVLPGEKSNFVVRIDGYLSTNKDKVNIKRSTIANMKTLPAAVASTYSLMGINGDWSTGKAFYEDLGGFYLLKNVTLTSTTEFKFRTGGVWGRPITYEKGRWAFTYDFPNDNMKGISGTFDIWVDSENDAVCFVDVNAAKPAFTKANKLVHILYEGTGNCGLYIQSPSTSVNNYNNSGAWGNFQTVYMKKTASESQNYCAFPLPSNVVGVSARFTIRVWGDKNKTYTMTINDDTPFWGNSDSGGSYTLSSKINIQ